jgi:hypothetical protein
MRQATASAAQAVSYAADAQSSAALAQASAEQAGQDAQAAADAASQAQETAAARRLAESEAAARAAAEEAKQNEENGTDPADQEEQDKPWYWEWKIWPEDIGDPKQWVEVTDHWASSLGDASLVFSLAAFANPPLGLAISAALGRAAWIVSGANVILNGFAYGVESAEFKRSLATFVVDSATNGLGRALKKFGVGEKAINAVENGIDVVWDTVSDLIDW